MMKKIYLTVISLAFLLASCNKWLDINPELEIRNDDMYSMEQGFMEDVYKRQGINGNSTMVSDFVFSYNPAKISVWISAKNPDRNGVFI